MPAYAVFIGWVISIIAGWFEVIADRHSKEVLFDRVFLRCCLMVLVLEIGVVLESIVQSSDLDGIASTIGTVLKAKIALISNYGTSTADST